MNTEQLVAASHTFMHAQELSALETVTITGGYGKRIDELLVQFAKSLRLQKPTTYQLLLARIERSIADVGTEREIFDTKAMAERVLLDITDLCGDSHQQMINHVDMMVDELKRIKALTSNIDGAVGDEITGICVRGIKNTFQHVPVITQRDKLLEALRDMVSQAISANDGDHSGQLDYEDAEALLTPLIP